MVILSNLKVRYYYIYAFVFSFLVIQEPFSLFTCRFSWSAESKDGRTFQIWEGGKWLLLAGLENYFPNNFLVFQVTKLTSVLKMIETGFD